MSDIAAVHRWLSFQYNGKVPAMDAKALRLARERADAAQRKLAAFDKADEWEQGPQLWSEFLIEMQRSFSKLQAGAKKDASAQWVRKITEDRSNDELLRYLHQARHADEHGLDQVTAETAEVKNLAPGAPKPLIWLTIKAKDGTEQVLGGPGAEWMIAGPPKTNLVSVVNRGIQYEPPTRHLGLALSETSAVAVGRLGLAYLLAKIAEAEALFTT